jgi:hypothetical protein
MLKERRDTAQHERVAPPVALRNLDFCTAPDAPFSAPP